ncbi:hypothetical protein [Streptomyces guryensis]|uniref:Uncharacterized protein n=1 Tax=Streptomyces guryensis TaxID=2886947 RepID=A0A9Q3VUU6_9ACTN|nr:hypothetical protein [Streptomyces guryensis]MCD9878162.1 hypothetical protein [Streptomyces guryensis]
MTTQQPIRVPVMDTPVAPHPHTGPAPDTTGHQDPPTRPAPQRQERGSASGTPRPPDAATRPTAATGYAATRGDA